MGENASDAFSNAIEGVNTEGLISIIVDSGTVKCDIKAKTTP